MELHGDAAVPGREQPVQRPGRGRELGALKVLSAVSEGGGTGGGWGQIYQAWMAMLRHLVLTSRAKGSYRRYLSKEVM